MSDSRKSEAAMPGYELTSHPKLQALSRVAVRPHPEPEIRDPGSSKTPSAQLLLMIEILHDFKDPKLWEIMVYSLINYGSCRIYIINRSTYFGV